MLLVDKPLRWTSFDVVKKIRSLINVKKVGHAGTLDPLASGLLIVCTGKFTKRINEFMAQEKEYTGTFALGAVTPTFDLESEPREFCLVEGLDKTKIIQATKAFTGTIFQVPPIHSAIKKDGKRSYELARKGETIELEPREIFIREFEITTMELPVVGFRVTCSSGTYIRSLANDFGQILGCGAYLSQLCRTRIGAFELKDAFSIGQLEEKIKGEEAIHQNG